MSDVGEFFHVELSKKEDVAAAYNLLICLLAECEGDIVPSTEDASPAPSGAIWPNTAKAAVPWFTLVRQLVRHSRVWRWASVCACMRACVRAGRRVGVRACVRAGGRAGAWSGLCTQERGRGQARGAC